MNHNDKITLTESALLFFASGYCKWLYRKSFVKSLTDNGVTEEQFLDLCKRYDGKEVLDYLTEELDEKESDLMAKRLAKLYNTSLWLKMLKTFIDTPRVTSDHHNG